jgi:uncharacterized protein with PIN domain
MPLGQLTKSANGHHLPLTSSAATRQLPGDCGGHRRKPGSGRQPPFDELVDAAELKVEPVTFDQARIARDAYRDFGKGSGHKAGLNFGDCFAYALAKATGEALLFKGDDFGHTDVSVALPNALSGLLQTVTDTGAPACR